jgi:hypothetical protein
VNTLLWEGFSCRIIGTTHPATRDWSQFDGTIFNPVIEVQQCLMKHDGVGKLILLVSEIPAMSLVESTAAFFQRCDEISPDGALRNALETQDIKTHSAMAFTMGTPQMPPTDEQFNQLAQRVFGPAPSVGQMSSIRRIHFESTTLVISTIREKVTSDGADKGDAARKVPLAEKKQRRED